MKIDSSYNSRLLASLAAQSAQALADLATPKAQDSRSAGLEEIGLGFSHHVERSSKALKQRQIRTTARNDQGEARIAERDRLDEEYDQLGHPGEESLGELAARTGAWLGEQPELDALVARTGGDPARTDVVLRQAESLAVRAGRRQEAERAAAYLRRLRERFGPQIRAGLNIAGALRLAGGDPALRQAVRQLYYDTVVLKQSLPGMLQALLGLFGEARFDEGLATLRLALADDIAAERPSRPTPRLRILLRGLGLSGQLGAVLQECRAALQRLATRRPQEQLDAVALLQRLLGFAAGGLTALEARRVGRELGGAEDEIQLVSLNVLYRLVQHLPLPLWQDDKHRQTALANLLALLDERSRGGLQARTSDPLAGVHP